MPELMTVNPCEVKLCDCMGSDYRAAEAARVSTCTDNDVEKDVRLIKFLGREEHWSPFSHIQLTFKVKMPIFVARQLVKHRVGCSWNEQSRRYSKGTVEFYIPPALYNQDGKHSVDVDQINAHNIMHREKMMTLCHNACVIYDTMIADGVANEQARMILPVNMMTTVMWTGSLYFFWRVWKERQSMRGAQRETTMVMDEITKICKELYPVCWSALNKD